LVEGKYGRLAKFMSPAYGRIIDRRKAAIAAIESRISGLTPLAEGEIAPAENANAAYHYMLGIALLAKLPPEQLLALRTSECVLGAPVASDLADALLAMQEAVGHFRDGAMLRRCDFTFGEAYAPRQFLAEHVPGMRDALR